MNKLFLKLSILGFALTSSFSTYAANSTIPSATPGFSFSVTGLYLQPNASNLEYAIFTQPLPLPAPNWSQVTLKPGYRPAFDLAVQYNFEDPANQVNLDWFYIHTDDSDSFSTSAANTSVAPPYYFGPLAQALTGTFADSDVKFDVSNVNLTFGRLINLGSSIQIEPFSGLEAAYIKEDIASTYAGTDSIHEPYSITQYSTSKFTGVGPRLGFNATYFITNHLGITARLGGSLLAGTMNSNTNFNSYGNGNKTPIHTKLADQDQNKVVSEVDSKLEINYMIPINQNESSVTIAIGYMFAAYINGINQIVPTSLVPGAFNQGAIAIETEGQNQSDLDLNGPYVTLTWKI